MRDLLRATVIACAALAAADPAASDTLFTNVTLVDVEAGALAAGQSVLIKDVRIAEIGTEIAAPDGTLWIDAN